MIVRIIVPVAAILTAFGLGVAYNATNTEANRGTSVKVEQPSTPQATTATPGVSQDLPVTTQTDDPAVVTGGTPTPGASPRPLPTPTPSPEAKPHNEPKAEAAPEPIIKYDRLGNETSRLEVTN